MKNFILTVATATMLGGLALGSASAAPMGPGGMQAGPSDVTQVRMTHGERMMMKKRMMRKQMMKRRMMKKRMMMNRM
ncbi:hypothetical protein ABZT49_19830 [Methylobacterium sp. EM32]|uniref:hypothetical protein n=1 Tax=Methylobacterium sp. EM32 TaxID=3163481 RepID=UPI0033A7CDED